MTKKTTQADGLSKEETKSLTIPSETAADPFQMDTPSLTESSPQPQALNETTPQNDSTEKDTQTPTFTKQPETEAATVGELNKPDATPTKEEKEDGKTKQSVVAKQRIPVSQKGGITTHLTAELPK